MIGNLAGMLTQSLRGEIDLEAIEIMLLTWLIEEIVTKTSEAGYEKNMKIYYALAEGIVETRPKWKQ